MNFKFACLLKRKTSVFLFVLNTHESVSKRILKYQSLFKSGQMSQTRGKRLYYGLYVYTERAQHKGSTSTRNFFLNLILSNVIIFVPGSCAMVLIITSIFFMFQIKAWQFFYFARTKSPALCRQILVYSTWITKSLILSAALDSVARYLGQKHFTTFIFSNYLNTGWLTLKQYIRKQTGKITSLPIPQSRIAKDLHLNHVRQAV